MLTLTGSLPRRDHGRAALLRIMTIIPLTLVSLRAGADPPRAVPGTLIERALHRAALDGEDPAPRRRASAFLPSLKLSAGVGRSVAPWRNTWVVDVLAQFSWPFGDWRAGDSRARIAPSQRLAARREQLIERVADLWKRREQLRRKAASTAERLDAEEADAELGALTGESP